MTTAVHNPVRTYIWAIVLIAAIAVAAAVVAVVALVTSVNADRRDLQRGQDAFCGLVVPISQQHASTELGNTIVSGAQRAAIVLHCPPVKGS